MKFKYLVVSLFFGIVLTACSNDDDSTTPIVPVALGDYENGVLVTHEGGFGAGNASVSYVSNDLSDTQHSIFESVNNTLLGDIAQSLTFYNDLAYIVVNNSKKIEVVNRFTFASIATISTGLNNPRYMAISNGKGYVTNWGDGSNSTDDFVAVINLETNTVESTISVEEGPEAILANSVNVYVAHEGGFSQNNKVSVINSQSNTLTTTLAVGDVPNSMQWDNSGNILVLCGGVPAWAGTETAGRLVKVNTSNNTTSDLILFETTEHPNNLVVSNEKGYFNLGGNINRFNSQINTPIANTIISGEAVYGMAVNNDRLFVTDAADFTSEGSLKIFDLSTNTKTKTITMGIIPSGVYFNE